MRRPAFDWRVSRGPGRIRLGPALLIAVALVAPAAASVPPPRTTPPAVSLASDGTAVVVYDAAGALKIASGALTGLGTPRLVPESATLNGGLWAVARPGGGALAVWEAELFDFRATDPHPAYAIEAADANGAAALLSPPQAERLTAADVASNADGDLVAAWTGAAATGVVTSAPGQPFAAVSGPVPARAVVDVAPGGRAMIVGDCETACVARERVGPGAEFGAAAPIPGATQLTLPSVAIASDGSALLAAVGPAGAVAFERPAGGEWGGAVELGPGGRVETGIGSDGRGVVAVRVFDAGGQLFELDGAGHATPSVDGYTQSSPVPLSVRDDGAAVAALGAGLARRAPGGTFTEPAPAPGAGAVPGALDLEAPGLLAATVVDEGDAFTYSALLGDRAVPLDSVAPTTLLPADPKPGLIVPPGRLRAHGTAVRVPLRCEDFPINACSGEVQGPSGAAVRYDVPASATVVITLRVGRAARRIRFFVDRDGRPDLTLDRDLDRTKPRCAIPPGARTLARAGAARLATTNVPSAGGILTRILACDPQGRTFTVSRTTPTMPVQEVAAGAMTGRRAATILRDATAGLLLTDLRTGTTRSRTLAARPYEGDREIASLHLTRAGAVAVIDTVDGRARVRAIDAKGDRILDPGPGVDPDTLRVAGDALTWMREGKPRRAVLSGPA